MSTFRYILALLLGPATAFAESEPVPERLTRPPIAPEQREALGLDCSPSQGAKVHPDVHRALQQGRPALPPYQFRGFAYVQVVLRHEQRGAPESAENRAALNQVQTAVLRRLTAAEFGRPFRFTTRPGLLGFASAEGVVKLDEDPNVIAVCLDDKPFPRYPPAVTAEDLPAPTSAPSEEHPKVPDAVFRALHRDGRVFVMVSLVFDRTRRLARAEVSEIENQVLSAVTADEFWVQSRNSGTSLGYPSLMGYANQEGLRTLANHPSVLKIGMNVRLRVPDVRRRRP
jgi:hypothetical protein